MTSTTLLLLLPNMQNMMYIMEMMVTATRMVAVMETDTGKAGFRLLQREAAIDEDSLAADLDDGAIAPTAAAERGESGQLEYSRIMVSTS